MKMLNFYLFHPRHLIDKHQIKMVAEGPLPDFMERKELLDVINEKLETKILSLGSVFHDF